MKTSHTVIAIVLSAATLGGAAFAASAPGSGPANGSAPAEAWLEIPAVYDKVIAAGYSDIIEIERERNGYEVKAVSAEGERVKLFVDPVTGEVLDARGKGKRTDRRGSDRFDPAGERAGESRQ